MADRSIEGLLGDVTRQSLNAERERIQRPGTAAAKSARTVQNQPELDITALVPKRSHRAETRAEARAEAGWTSGGLGGVLGAKFSPSFTCARTELSKTGQNRTSPPQIDGTNPTDLPPRPRAPSRPRAHPQTTGGPFAKSLHALSAAKDLASPLKDARSFAALRMTRRWEGEAPAEPRVPPQGITARQEPRPPRPKIHTLSG